MDLDQINTISNIVHYNQVNLENLKVICDPLKYLEIDSLTYLRIYLDGNAIRLGTNLQYDQYSLENDVTLKSKNLIKMIAGVKKVDIPYFAAGAFADDLKHFGINSLILSIRRGKGYIECWGISSARNDKDMTDSLMSNLSEVERFMTFFNSKAKAIIDTAYQNKILIQTRLNIREIYDQKPCKRLNSFLKATELKEWPWQINGTLTSLTRNEVIILSYLVNGLISKEIACKLQCTVSEIEKRIKDLKAKSGLSSMQMLIDAFIRSDLYKVSPIHTMTHQQFTMTN